MTYDLETFAHKIGALVTVLLILVIAAGVAAHMGYNIPIVSKLVNAVGR